MHSWLRVVKQSLRHPRWLQAPNCLQLDTHNYCNLDCSYCNVQHSFNLPRGDMPSSNIQKVLAYWRGKGPKIVAPFLNGEPLLECRLPQICDLSQEYGYRCTVDTNGTLYQFRDRLVHPALTLVRFTISAATPETYLKVHGQRWFDSAVRTFEWFLDNKYPSQTAWLHFICTRDNEHEVEMWSERFRGTAQTVFPVHHGAGQVESRKSAGTMPEPFMVDAQGHRHQLWPNPSSPVDPCPCWSILPISWRGDLMQCTDFPYHYNWGNVGTVDMGEAWRQRVENRMDNPCCNSCSLRFPTWNTIMERYVS